MENVAAIDVGSHTARLLIARKAPLPERLTPLLRKRVYIRLAEDFHEPEKGMIKAGATARTLEALEAFEGLLKEWEVRETRAVATGVVREALNREWFLDLIFRKTGIRVRTVTGEEEALLTGRGVLHALPAGPGPFVVFDLGGGSTEFLLGGREGVKVLSLPLGAAVLTGEYLRGDPPEEGRIESLLSHVDEVLSRHLASDGKRFGGGFVAGTGGTATTLAAMVHGIEARRIDPEHMNGLGLSRQEIEGVLGRLRSITRKERLSLTGLEPGREGVILAGTLVLERIMHYFRATRIVVSLSDLLEGVLMGDAEGGQDEQSGH